MPARRRDPLARDLRADLQVAATKGSMLTDSRSRKYIDFVMGWCVGNRETVGASAISSDIALAKPRKRQRMDANP